MMVQIRLSQFLRLFVVTCFTLALAACSEAQFLAAGYKEYRGAPASQGLFKVGKPYSVAGATYRPTESYSLDETGIASWYGPGFHSKTTANGEEFSENELTAAHRTLQLPSLVRVTNLENGKSVVVRVNDRGPFARGRIIDVSKKAADLLGFRGKGTARVRVQVLAEESRLATAAAKQGKATRGMELALNNGQTLPGMAQPAALGTGAMPPPDVPPPGSYQTAALQPVQAEALQAPLTTTDAGVYSPSGVPGHVGPSGAFYPDPVVKQFPVTPTSIYVQAGSFGNYDNAIRVSQSLTGLGPVRLNPVTVGGRQYFRVQMGPIATVGQADQALSQVVSKGYPDARIVVDNSS